MIYYIYRKQGYKSLLQLNEKYIFESVFLVVVKMKNSTMKVVDIRFSLFYIYIFLDENIYLHIM